jgi:hypothetical protein
LGFVVAAFSAAPANSTLAVSLAGAVFAPLFVVATFSAAPASSMLAAFSVRAMFAKVYLSSVPT